MWDPEVAVEDLVEEAGDEAVEAEVDAVEVEKEGQVGQDELGVEAEVEKQAEEGVVILSKKMIWNKEWQYALTELSLNVRR